MAYSTINSFLERSDIDDVYFVCPECGKEVSSRAKACPNCGCPITDGNNANETQPGVQRMEVEGVPVIEATPKDCKVLQLVGVIGCLLSPVGCITDSGNVTLYTYTFWGSLIIFVCVSLYVWWNHR